jgi:hypothetical protein
MSDWRSDLKMLQRRPPSKNIMQTIINVMSSDTDDRAAAILAGSLVEVSLVGPIALITRRQEHIEQDFWRTGAPHRWFANKIIKAASLGIIGPQTTSNLEVIRLVRNAFAHSLSEIEFTTPEVERACSQLTLSRNAEFFVTGEPTRKARYRYCYACDAVFRGLLAYVLLPWVAGSGWPEPPTQPILP